MRAGRRLRGVSAILAPARPGSRRSGRGLAGSLLTATAVHLAAANGESLKGAARRLDAPGGATHPPSLAASGWCRKWEAAVGATASCAPIARGDKAVPRDARYRKSKGNIRCRTTDRDGAPGP